MPKTKTWNSLLSREVKPRKATGAGATIPAGQLEGHMDRQRKGLNSDPERVLQELLVLVRRVSPPPREVSIEPKKIVVESQGITITITAK